MKLSSLLLLAFVNMVNARYHYINHHDNYKSNEPNCVYSIPEDENTENMKEAMRLSGCVSKEENDKKKNTIIIVVIVIIAIIALILVLSCFLKSRNNKSRNISKYSRRISNSNVNTNTNTDNEKDGAVPEFTTIDIYSNNK